MDPLTTLGYCGRSSSVVASRNNFYYPLYSLALFTFYALFELMYMALLSVS